MTNTLTSRNQSIATRHLYSFQDASNTQNISPRRLNGADDENAAQEENNAAGRFVMPALNLSQVLKEKPNGSIITPQKISLVDKYITRVDKIPKKYTKIDTLFLSNNCIESLNGIQQFQHLNVLSIANNCIASFYELNYLNQLPQLKVLNLEFNPLTQMPYYRYQAIQRVPSVRLLDQKEVTSGERSKAAKVLKKEETTLNLMFSNEALIAKISRAIEQSRVSEAYRNELLERLDTYHMEQLRSLDANAIIDIWEMPELYTEEDRPVVYELLRKEVRKIHNIRLFGGGSMREAQQNTLPVVGKKSNKLQAAQKKKRQSYESWDICYSEVLLHQQSKIASLLYELEQEHTELVGELEEIHQHELRMHSGTAMRSRTPDHKRKDVPQPPRRSTTPHRDDTQHSTPQRSHTPLQNDEGLKVVRQIQNEMNELMSSTTSTSRMLDNFSKNYQFEEAPHETAHQTPLSKDALKTPKRMRESAPTGVLPQKTASHEHATTLAYSLPPKQQEPHIFPQELSPEEQPSSPHAQHRSTTPLSRTMPVRGARHDSMKHDSRPTTNTVHFRTNTPQKSSTPTGLASVPPRTNTPVTNTPSQYSPPHEDVNSLRSTVRDLKHEIEKRKRGEETLQELNVQLRERLEEFKLQNSQNVDRAFHEVNQQRRELDALRREFREKTNELERSKLKTAELERTLVILRDTPNRGDLIDQLREMREEKERLELQLMETQRSALSGSASMFGVSVADGNPDEFLRTVSQIVSTAHPLAPSIDMDVVKFFAENEQAERLRRRCVANRQRERLRFTWRAWRRSVLYAKRAQQLQPVLERSLLKESFSKWRKELRSRMTAKTRMEHARLHHEHRIMRRTFDAWRAYRVQSLEINHIMEQEAESMSRQLLLKHAFSAWKQWMDEYVYSFRQKVAAFRDYHYRRLLVNMFYRWKERYQQRLELHRKEHRATDHHNYRIVKHTFQAWRDYSRFKLQYQVQKQQADIFHNKLLVKKSLRILARTALHHQRTKSAHIRAYDFLFQSLRRKYFNALRENARNAKRKRNLQQKANTFLLKKYFSHWLYHTRRATHDRRIELVAEELYQRRCKQLCQQFFFQWREAALKKRRLYNILVHSEERLNIIKKKFFFSTWRTRYTQKLHFVISQMDQSVRHLQSESMSFTSSKQDYELQNLNLVQKLHEMSGDISKHKVTISDQQKQISRLEGELNDAAMIEQSLRGEITSLREQNNDFRDEIDTLKSQLVQYAEVSPESLESVLEKQNAQEQIASLKHTMASKNREIDRLKAMLATFEGGDSQQKHKLRDAFEMIAQLRTAIEEKDEELLRLRAQSEQNDNLVQNWRRRMEKEEHEILQKNETIRTLNQKLRDAKERSKMYNDSARDKDEEIEKMKFEMDLMADADESGGEGAESPVQQVDERGSATNAGVHFSDDDQELRDTVLAHSVPAHFQYMPRRRSSSDEDESTMLQRSALPSKLLSPYSSVSSLPVPVRQIPDTTVYSATESTQLDEDDYDDEIKKLTSSIMSGLDDRV